VTRRWRDHDAEHEVQAAWMDGDGRDKAGDGQLVRREPGGRRVPFAGGNGFRGVGEVGVRVASFYPGVTQSLVPRQARLQLQQKGLCLPIEGRR
jgi:hypothetical protein